MNTTGISTLAIAVDLTPLRPGGANGGIKPAIFSLLAESLRQQRDDWVFIYLTNSATHSEVRQFARAQDILICVLEEQAFPLELHSRDRAEFRLIPPPAHLVQLVGADLLYCPFGACTYHAPPVPTVALIADLLHRDYPEALNSAQIAEREAYIIQTLEKASMIQCISRSGIEQMIKHYQVAEERLFYTYLPVQVRSDVDGVAIGNFVEKAGLEAPFFFYPANLWQHKNHETLLIAYRFYRQQAGDTAWDLVLTFHEDKRAAAIRELSEALGLAGYVHFLGYVSETGLQALWSRAGALVFPSLHEGFGIPVIEAMHHGVPVICGWDYSLKEIVADAGCRVEPRNPESIAKALLAISTDLSLRAKLVHKGKQRLKLFNLEVEVRKLVSLLSMLPERKGSFPRKAKVLEQPCALAVPCPASDELWSFQVRVNPKLAQNRYSIYLDDAAYGSFSATRCREAEFCFVCRPSSRTLRVVIANDRTVLSNDLPVVADAIEEITTMDAGGETVHLYRKPANVLA